MKWLVRMGFTISVCSSLSGCASTLKTENNPVEVSRHIQVKHDAFQIVIKQDESTKVTSYTGPNCAKNPIDHIVLIRAWQTGETPLTYQVYVSDQYTHERKRGGIDGKPTNTAYDIDGNTLPADVLSRDVNWCGKDLCQYVEAVGVAVTRPYLEDRIGRGLTLKISGTSGEGIVNVPAAYVQAFLKKVSEHGIRRQKVDNAGTVQKTKY